MRVGPPRINLAMFRLSSNSSCQLNQTWIINDAKSTWVAFTRKKMRLEKNFIDCFANEFEKFFRTIANKETCNLFLIPPTIVFLPACVDTRKINLEVGALVQDPMMVMTLNLTGWHSQVRRCVWNRILLIVSDENWKPVLKTSRTNTHPIYFYRDT
jgi:hypothetical protein